MLIEIPDPEVIFNVIVAFLVGLFGLYAYYKIGSLVNLKRVGTDTAQAERLEQYERQLIDMKIRLDALGLEGLDPKTTVAGQEEEAGEVRQPPPPAPQAKAPEVVPGPPPATPIAPQAQRLPNMTTNHAIDYVLQLITDKPMTSRDIQITLGRSREHTSRLMKRLFEEEYVNRDVNSKPYVYTITKKGQERIGSVDGSAAVAA